MKRKWIKYTVRTILAVIVAWILFLGIAFFYVKESDPQEQHPGNNYSYNGPYSILYPFSFHARGWFKK